MYLKRSKKVNKISEKIALFLRQTPAYIFSSKQQETSTYLSKAELMKNVKQQEKRKYRRNEESTAFEKFREYVELKRQETSRRVEQFKQAATGYEAIKGMNERLVRVRSDQYTEDRLLLMRPKQTYERYRQYIARTLPLQMRQTHRLVTRRQREETALKQSTRQRQQRHTEQRSNVILLGLGFILLVVVAILIVQLVV